MLAFRREDNLNICVCPDCSSICEGSGSEIAVQLVKNRVIPLTIQACPEQLSLIAFATCLDCHHHNDMTPSHPPHTAPKKERWLQCLIQGGQLPPYAAVKPKDGTKYSMCVQ